MLARALLLLVTAAALTGCHDGAGPTDDVSTVVATDSGPVQGVAHDGVMSWKGVPYAAPPVGDLRWRPPQPVEPWTEVRDGSAYGAVCLQGPSTNIAEALTEVGRSGEDCLTLNVHRPAGADEAGPLPVMVWIHGGGFVFGAGSQAMFNSPELVRRGVVLVTFNYRLGRLGFLAHPALQDGGSPVANFGLLDQVAALQWVQDNIAAFGGDPANVTVFGESAGGASVNALMVSPAAEGLFARAISQSGFGREPGIGWDEAAAEASAALTPLAGSNPSASDLRALGAEQVMAVTPAALLHGQLPVIDAVLPRSVDEAFRAGDELDVPYLTGTTDLEVPDDAGVAGMRAGDVRSLLLGERREQALAAYADEAELGRHLLSDVLFGEPARHLAREHSDAAPTYRYRFAIADQSLVDALGGAPHTAELPFVFDDTRRQGHPLAGAEGLADSIADLWVGFATDGEPDGWPLEDTGQVMTFTIDGPVVGVDPWAARLDVVQTGYEELLVASPPPS